MHNEVEWQCQWVLMGQDKRGQCFNLSGKKWFRGITFYGVFMKPHAFNHQTLAATWGFQRRRASWIGIGTVTWWQPKRTVKVKVNTETACRFVWFVDCSSMTSFRNSGRYRIYGNRETLGMSVVHPTNMYVYIYSIHWEIMLAGEIPMLPQGSCRH